MNRIIKYTIFIVYIVLLSSVANATSNIVGATANYHQGDFETAMFQFQQIADKHSPQAAKANFMLGSMYERGDGVMIDDQIALAYYEISAKAGYAEAKQRLQAFLSEGSIVQDWYMESAWDGDTEAQYNLGYLFETGIGVQIDKARAIQWYTESAKEQNKNAQFRLGLMLITPEAQNREFEKGKAWIKAAADNGHVVAVAMVDALFESASDRAILFAARGIRTYEQSLTRKMLDVVIKAASPSMGLQDTAVLAQAKPKNRPQNPKHQKAGLEQSLPGKSVNTESASHANFTASIGSNTIQVVGSQVVTHDLGDTSFIAVSNEKNAEEPTFVVSQKSNFNSRSVLIGISAVICFLLIGFYFWRKHSAVNDKTYHLVGLSSSHSDKQTATYVDISKSGENSRGSDVDKKNEATSNMHKMEALSLIERLMSDPAKETMNKTTSIDFQMKLPNKLACDTFLPVDTSDISFHHGAIESAVEGRVFKGDDLFIELNDSHAVENIVERPVNYDNSTVEPSNTLEMARLDLLNDDFRSSIDSLRRAREEGIGVDDGQVTFNKMSALAKVLKNELAKDLSEDLSRELSKDLTNILSKDLGDTNDAARLADSYYSLGKMFIQGDGITVNKQLGKRWLQKAADNGHRLALAELKSIDLDSEPSDYLQISSAS